MTAKGLPAFFLWVGGALPPLARLCVLSAARAGFHTILFSDRHHDLPGSGIEQADFREIYSEYGPEDITIRGRPGPAYAAFSDVFRFALLAGQSGWWFDCDTLVLRPRQDFDELLAAQPFVIGRETPTMLNGAVIGSTDVAVPSLLLASTRALLPELSKWGVIGPALISQKVACGEISADALPIRAFYPVHHEDIGAIYQPERRAEMEAATQGSYCLSLWNEVLGQTGLRHVAPPAGSFLAELLASRFGATELVTDDAALVDFLVSNKLRLDTLDSGAIALRTILRKTRARLGLDGQ